MVCIEESSYERAICILQEYICTIFQKSEVIESISDACVDIAENDQEAEKICNKIRRGTACITEIAENMSKIIDAMQKELETLIMISKDKGAAIEQYD